MDRLTYRSIKEGYRARSVYKLKELNWKHHIFKPGNSVFDIGCWPGSWLQYCKELGCTVSGVDLLVVEGFTTIVGDILEDSTLTKIKGTYDVVLSDVAPKTSGIIVLDQERSLELSRRAFFIGRRILKPNGTFVCKIFQGGGVPRFMAGLKPFFRSIRLVQLEYSRKGSKEAYLVCKGFSPHL